MPKKKGNVEPANKKHDQIKTDTVVKPKNEPTVSIEWQLVRKWNFILIIVSSVIARLILYNWCGQWLSTRPELSTPLVSIDRLKEGVLLKKDTGNPYFGDRVHVTPLMLSLLPQTNDNVLLIMLIIVDTLSGVILSVGSSKFAAQRGQSIDQSIDIGTNVLKWYLLNPISMATCCSLSLSVILIHLLSIFTAAFLYGESFIASFVLAISTQFSLYPIVLLAPLLNQMAGRRVLALTVFVVTLSALSLLNFTLGGNSWEYVNHTYLFNLMVLDLTPNVGIFWYFFTEIFTHFFDFFLILFQLNVVVYILPLALTLRNAPFLNLLVSFALIAVFVPYPSLSDGTVFFSLLPLVEERHWKGMRHVLVESCTILTCIALMPIMWHMWVVSGSGNANFYFGVTLFYNVALIRMGIDIVYSYVRTDLEERCPEDIQENSLIYFD
ncbi:hypothetical protein PFISCL1PPCAC_19719 [Pristionchus fissidentatus]|uniref:G protein-coupled receptor n=1 Tax=Pristionchus fissidentatus TaxID=1538716 RepID=A0AAV5WER1_9BILA|nr:hypothetical protein PFISCL1PPCAC_19719 [Pristionchus fissidentatus]